ncbi:MAG: hypothetical protein AAF393_05040 [Pseudomonadota bacterium]
MSDFSDFAEAAAKGAGTRTPPAPLSFSRFAVLGGGADARLIAAVALAEGKDVTLFSAYGAELERLRAGSGIGLRGAGPVGTYQVDRDAAPSVRTTAEIDAAVTDAEVIFLTGPIHKQRTYAMVLADHLKDGQVLVLAPGRSLGALETAWMLRIGGATADVTIVEAQGLPFWYREEGALLHLSARGPVPAATLPSGRADVLAALAPVLSLKAVESVVASGFADGSAIVEFPALLMSGPALGSGAVSIPMGGVALPENQTFAALIGPEQRNIINQLADERRAVAHAFGVRDLPDTDAWIDVHAGAARGDGARSQPDTAEAKALLRCGVIGSLVPLVSAAELAGVEVPVTQSMITLAGAVLGADVAAAGRRLDQIGIRETEAATARRAMDRLATGAA